MLDVGGLSDRGVQSVEVHRSLSAFTGFSGHWAQLAHQHNGSRSHKRQRTHEMTASRLRREATLKHSSPTSRPAAPTSTVRGPGLRLLGGQRRAVAGRVVSLEGGPSAARWNGGRHAPGARRGRATGPVPRLNRHAPRRCCPLWRRSPTASSPAGTFRRLHRPAAT